MTKKTAQTEFDPDEILVAREGFSGELEDGTPVAYKQGARVRANIAAVRRWPSFWIADGEPLTPVPRPEPEPEPPPKRRKPPRMYRATRRVMDGFGSGVRIIEKGDLLPETDPWVRAFGDAFEVA